MCVCVYSNSISKYYCNKISVKRHESNRIDFKDYFPNFFLFFPVSESIINIKTSFSPRTKTSPTQSNPTFIEILSNLSIQLSPFRLNNKILSLDII